MRITYNSVFILLVLLTFCNCQAKKERKRHKRAASKEISSQIASLKLRIEASQLLLANNPEQVDSVYDRINLPFRNPPEIQSTDQKLDTEFKIDFATNLVYNTAKQQNIRLYHRSYNGQLVGPTLRMKPGDSLFIQLMNQLPALVPSQPCDPYAPFPDSIDGNIIDSLRFNNTNLHVHGLHVSPMGHGDNVFVNLAPECNFQNRIGVPYEHAPGTFWYHPHVHGSTAIQVSSSMGGALIIEGGLDDQEQIKEMEEKVFVLQQMPYTPDTTGNIDNNRYVIEFLEGTTFGPGTWQKGIDSLSSGWHTTINGMTIPVIEMQSEEVQRWRFIHAGVRETINLKLGSLKGDTLIFEKLYAIAEDGIAYGYRSDVDSMILQPGYRADLLIQSTLEQGKSKDTLFLFDLETGALDGDNLESDKILAMVVLSAPNGNPVATQLPSSEDLAGYAPFPSLVDVPVTDSMQYVKFNIIPRKPKPALYQINGVSFNHENPPRTLTLNKIQEWTLTSGLAGHPFHIHINHFQVQQYFSRDSVTAPWVDQKIAPIWKDTYYVGQNDSIIMKTVYKNFIGDFVLHCHILDHEDQGMMQCVRIDSANTIIDFLDSRGIRFCGPEYSNSLSILTE